MAKSSLFKRFIIGSTLITALGGCQFTSDRPEESQEIYDVNNSETAVTCVLDPKSFALILDEPITTQIDCLEKNLFQFTKLVRREDPNTITEAELSKFVYKFFKDEKPENIVGALKLVFELNAYLFKDRSDKISKENISALFKIISIFNIEGVNLKNAFKEMTGENYLERRSLIFGALKRLGDGFIAHSKISNKAESEFDLVRFIVLLNNQLTKHPIDVQLITAFLPIKELLFGGAPSLFSHQAGIAIFKEAPSLIISLLDIVHEIPATADPDFDQKRIFVTEAAKNLDRSINALMGTKSERTEIDLYALMINLDRELESITLSPDLVRVVFDLKELLLSNERRLFSDESLKILLKNSASLLNSFLRMTHSVRDLDADRFKERKDEIHSAVTLLSDTFLTIMGDHQNNRDNSIDLLWALETISKEFKLKINLTFVRAILPIKELILGGDKKLLKTFEFTSLLKNLAPMLTSTLSLYFETKELSRENYSAHRDSILKMARLAARSIEKMAIETHADRRLNIQEFFIELRASLPDSNINFDFLESLFPIKQLLVGGDYFYITSGEVVQLLSNLENMVIGALDASFSIKDLTEGNFPERKNDILTGFKNLTNATKVYLEKEIINRPDFPINNFLELLANSSTDIKDTISLLKALIPIKNVLVGGTDGLLTASEGILLLEELPMIATQSLELSFILKKINKDNYWKERPLLIAQIEEMIQTLTRLHRRSGNVEGAINLNRFFIDLAKNSTFDFDLDLILRLLFVKKAIVAGNKEILIHQEVPILFSKAQRMFTYMFDLLYFKTRTSFDDEEKTLYLLSILAGINDLIEPQDEEAPLFSNEDLNIIGNQALKGRFSKEVDLNKFQISIYNLKEKIIGRKFDEDYTVKDLKTIFRLILEGLESIYFNAVSYEHFKTEFEKPTPIPELTRPNLSEYRHIPKERIEKHWSTFTKIARDYRFFRERGGIQFYANPYQRTKYGFNELTTVRYIFSLLLTVDEFAHEAPNRSGHFVANQKELDQIFLSFKDLLQEFKLWPTKFETFSRNTLLLADLFQFQSDGDGSLGLEEATEYMALVITAVKIGSDLSKKLSAYCSPGDNPDEPSFVISCYRKHFFPIIMNQLGNKKYLPKLAKFAESNSEEVIASFLADIEVFARDIPDDRIRINQREFTLIFGAILNIESTLIRFDLNDSNVVEKSELERAFFIYRDTILRYAPAANFLKHFAKSLFFYTLKKKSFPGNLWTILTYHYFGDKKVDAQRSNIGALLSNVVKLANAQKPKPTETPKGLNSADLPNLVDRFIRNEPLEPNEVNFLKAPLLP